MPTKYNDINIYIATPSYGGMVTTIFLTSMLNLSIKLMKHGIKMTFKPVANEALITRCRNSLFSEFLENKEFTHFMFIDADIGFDANDILKLIDNNKPIVGGTYPHKGIQWSKFNELINKDPLLLKNTDKLESISNNYSVDLYYKRDENNLLMIEKEKNMIKAKYIPTGFMMIKREVGEKMIEKYPEDWYNNDMVGYKMKKVWNFFDCFICKDENRYLSEDYAFCRRWIDCGGEIWLNCDINLTHMGAYCFKGSYMEKLLTYMK